NRLRIRVNPDEGATAKPPLVPAFSAGVQPAAIPLAVGNSGTLVEIGSRVASGSSVTAGAETAVLRLTRGGEVRVCPGTTVSDSTSAGGQDLMLGLSKGGMETHYGLQESVDAIVTPDFRIVLPGPGEFNLAVRADNRGNTCVGSLPGSTSSAVVAELLGNGTYEIHPEQQVLFRQGRLDSVEVPVASCGCPPPPEPVLRTSTPTAVEEAHAGQRLELASASDLAGTTPGVDPGVATAGPAKTETMKVAVEAPLVFSGRDLARARAAAMPAAPMPEVTALPIALRRTDPLPAVVVLPP